jgi:hypothetical protein
MEFNNQFGNDEIQVVAVYSAADVEQRRFHRLELDTAHLLAANYRVALERAQAIIAQRDVTIERAEAVIVQRDAIIEQAALDLAQNDHALEQARLDLTQRDHALEHERAHSQEIQAANVELVAQLAVGNDRQNENRNALQQLREETQQEIGDLRRLIDQHEHMECVVCLTSYVELNQIGNYFENLNSYLTFYFYLKCFSYK